MRRLEMIVRADQDGRSVQSVLRGEYHFSGKLLRSLKWRENAILRNGSPVRVTATVCAGDALTVLLAERHAPSAHVQPCAFPLEIVYEDEDLLVLNKPAGFSMHSGSPSMAGALLSHGGGAVHFVNRLDRGTSGLCIAARSGYIHDRLRLALHSEALYREYLGFAEGVVTPPRGALTFPIRQVEGRFYQYCAHRDGLPSRTEYEVLAQTRDHALLRLIPRTGRTHQLRVHMSAAGHPLLGDPLYGARQDSALTRPALHSHLLRFTHPLSGRELCFTAPLPEDLRRVEGAEAAPE